MGVGERGWSGGVSIRMEARAKNAVLTGQAQLSAPGHTFLYSLLSASTRQAKLK